MFVVESCVQHCGGLPNRQSSGDSQLPMDIPRRLPTGLTRLQCNIRVDRLALEEHLDSKPHCKRLSSVP